MLVTNNLLADDKYKVRYDSQIIFKEEVALNTKAELVGKYSVISLFESRNVAEI